MAQGRGRGPCLDPCLEPYVKFFSKRFLYAVGNINTNLNKNFHA